MLERGFDNITKMVFAFKGKEVKLEVLMVYNMVCEFYSHTILYTIKTSNFTSFPLKAKNILVKNK